MKNCFHWADDPAGSGVPEGCGVKKASLSVGRPVGIGPRAVELRSDAAGETLAEAAERGEVTHEYALRPQHAE